MACPACTIDWSTTHPSDFNRPRGWQSSQVLGDQAATWMTPKGNRSEIVVCRECGMRARLDYCERDGGSWSVTEFSPESDAVVQADAAPLMVFRAVFSQRKTLDLAKEWVANAPYEGADLVSAVRTVLPTIDTVTKAFACLQLIRWSLDNARVTSALLSATDLLRDLFHLPDRLPLGRDGLLSTVFDELQSLLENPLVVRALSPAMRIEIKGCTAPAARIRPSMTAIRGYLAGDVPSSVVHRALLELDHFRLRSAPMTSVDVDTLLALQCRLRAAGANWTKDPLLMLSRCLTRLVTDQLIPESIESRVRSAMSPPV